MLVSFSTNISSPPLQSGATATEMSLNFHNNAKIVLSGDKNIIRMPNLKTILFPYSCRVFKINQKTMNSKILVFVAFAAIVFTACNHNSSSDVKLKKLTSSRGFTEFYYGPDNKVSYTMNSNGMKTIYKFSDKTVEQKMTDSTSGRSATATFYLNAKGWADSCVTVQGPMSYLSTFKYADGGFMTEIGQYQAGSLMGLAKNTFKDGNKVSTVNYDTGSTALSTIVFDYNDKANSIGFSAQGLNFLGNDSKNLPKKLVQIRGASDTLGTIDFVYHFDEKGRVSSQVVYQGPQKVDSTSYSYY